QPRLGSASAKVAYLPEHYVQMDDTLKISGLRSPLISTSEIVGLFFEMSTNQAPKTIGRGRPATIAGSRSRSSAASCRSTRIHGAVDAAFELAVERKRRPIGKGQNLGHEHGSDALCRIDPVISIEETRPRKTAGAAAVRPRLHVDHVAKTPSQRNARKEIDIVRECRIVRLHNSGLDLADLILAHEGNSLRAQDTGAVELTPLQQHADEGQVIGSGRIEAAAAGEGRRSGRRLQGLGQQGSVRLAQVRVCSARALR